VHREAKGFAPDRFSRRTGEGVGRWNPDYILDCNVESVQAELEQQARDTKAHFEQQQARRSTPEYKLASSFINSAEPELSIEAFASLGIEKLNRIVQWLNESKP